MALKAPGPDGHLTKSVVGRVQVSVGGRAALAALHHESSIVVKEEAASRAHGEGSGRQRRRRAAPGGERGRPRAARQQRRGGRRRSIGPPPRPAAARGQENAVSACLKMGAIPDARNVARMTPLHWASAWATRRRPSCSPPAPTAAPRTCGRRRRRSSTATCRARCGQQGEDARDPQAEQERSSCAHCCVNKPYQRLALPHSQRSHHSAAPLVPGGAPSHASECSDAAASWMTRAARSRSSSRSSSSRADSCAELELSSSSLA